MGIKKYAYIRTDIPEDDIVPTSEGYEIEGTQLPIIQHNTLYAVIPHGEEFDNEEFSIHLEVKEFPVGVFVNSADFNFVEVEIPEKDVEFVLRFEEMRTATISVRGKNKDDISTRYQSGEFDNMIAVSMNEQQDLSFQQMFFDGGVDSIDRWV